MTLEDLVARLRPILPNLGFRPDLIDPLHAQHRRLGKLLLHQLLRLTRIARLHLRRAHLAVEPDPGFVGVPSKDTAGSVAAKADEANPRPITTDKIHA